MTAGWLNVEYNRRVNVLPEGGGQRSKVDGRVPAITQTREEAEPMFSVQNILYMFRT